MVWVVVAAAGLFVALSVAFWQKIVTWANQHLTTWLGTYFGEDVREAFLLILAGGDRLVIAFQRAVEKLQSRLVRARVFFRQLLGGREHERVVQAELRQDNGEIVKVEAAEVVPWHELPDDVREKFIRRQSTSVELELTVRQ
jgi:hypothetical protein